MQKFRFILTFVLVCWSSLLLAQVKIASWNLENFGKTKTSEEISFIAETIRDFDVVAIQEVVAGPGGAQAVARLADELNRKGTAWDYTISNPTKSTPYATERYAYLWKTAKVQQEKSAALESYYVAQVDREPYMIELSYEGNCFTLVNFHAIPQKKQPETELKYFKFLPEKYPDENLIFLGDFNLPQQHTVFNPLKKMGYRATLQNQKTTMKMTCVQEDCLASAYDNIFYNTHATKFMDSGVVLFYEAYPDMISAREISDHIPVWAEFDF